MTLTRAALWLGDVPAVMCAGEEPRGTVLLLHGLGGAKEDLLEELERFARAGFRAIALDLAGHGEHPSSYLMERLDAGDDEESAFLDIVQASAGDLSAVLDELARRGWLEGGRAAVVGSSAGGFVALAARVVDARVDVIVAVSASPKWALERAGSPAESLVKFPPAAVLLLHGAHDDVVDPVPGAAFIAVLQRMYGDPARVEHKSYPSSGHIFTPRDSADAWRRALAWCERFCVARS